MYCLRCGRDTSGDHIFCDGCQQSMEAYPVKPGTPVHLPQKKAGAPARKRFRRKRQITPEDQVVLLKKTVRQYRVLLAVTVFLLGLTIGLLFHDMSAQESNIGRNYAVDTTQQAD